MSHRPTRPPTRRALAKIATHDKVLAAARQAFLMTTYEAATIRDIAESCGVSTGSVFSSFKSKEEMLLEVLRADKVTELERFRDDVGASAEYTLIQRLDRALSHNYVDWQNKNYLLNARFSRAGSTDELSKYIDDTNAEFVGIMSAILLEQRVPNAEGIAKVIWAVHTHNLAAQARAPLVITQDPPPEHYLRLLLLL